MIRQSWFMGANLWRWFLFCAEWGYVAAGEEAVDVGLGVPVFVAVAGVAEETVVAEAFQVAAFYAKECHQGFVVVKGRGGECGNPFLLTLQQEQDSG